MVIQGHGLFKFIRLMIASIIQDVVEKMQVFKTVDILRGVQTTYGVLGIITKYFILDAAEGDLTSKINIGDKVWPQGGTWNYPPTVAAIRTVAAVDFINYFGSDVTRLDVTTYPESADNTTIVVTDLTKRYYSVTLNSSDIQYWCVGARMRFKDSGVYYYGVVTEISSPVIIVKMDTSDELSSITEFAMDINWKYGHPKDVFNEISKMAGHPDFKARRFPVLALLQDFDEELNAGIDEVPIQLILGVDTQPHFNTKERYEASYTGRKLTLLYQRFIQYLEWNTSTYFRRGDATKTDRVYWGKDGALGTDENKADEFIDAIEININLKVLSTC